MTLLSFICLTWVEPTTVLSRLRIRDAKSGIFEQLQVWLWLPGNLSAAADEIHGSDGLVIWFRVFHLGSAFLLDI